jgi:hypothetical protein
MNAYTPMVSKGMARMDERVNPRWFEIINSEILDMSLGNRCIVGQYFGDYATGMVVLGIPLNEAHLYGFNLNNEDLYADSEGEEYALLEVAWIDAINERIAATL